MPDGAQGAGSRRLDARDVESRVDVVGPAHLQGAAVVNNGLVVGVGVPWKHPVAGTQRRPILIEDGVPAQDDDPFERGKIGVVRLIPRALVEVRQRHGPHLQPREEQLRQRQALGCGEQHRIGVRPGHGPDRRAGQNEIADVIGFDDGEAHG